ncbi:MAG: HlyD family efflux transporter periplasmic adaptor subunit [Planctomycetales bacterium]|nr:HlyD family efflux transporter periplasmic adaptor subunit [Planctomycetales bacterium]
MAIPLPRRVWGTLELEPHGARQVYVDVPGRLQTLHVHPGLHVDAGTPLAQLENLDLDREIAELAGRADVVRSELSTLRVERFQDVTAGERISEKAEELQGLERSLAQKQSQRQSLTLTAAASGVVLPPPETPRPKPRSLGQLTSWHGHPGDRRNVGAFLSEGTLFCRIGDGRTWQAVTVVDESDIELLNVGQTVDLQIDSLPHLVLTGTVAEISGRELAESSARLSNKHGGELATQTDEGGVERPISATYQVQVVVQDDSGILREGLRGRARIHVPSASLAGRSWRWFSRTFHFDL